MKKETEARTGALRHKTKPAALSMAAVSATVVLASITHASEFGHRAFIAGLMVIALLGLMNSLYLRTGTSVFLVLYGLINAWVIIGFGLFSGFWNHAFKVFLYYLHNGSLPPLLAKLFAAPGIGSPFFEGAGVLTFALSLCAAYFGYKFMKEGR